MGRPLEERGGPGGGGIGLPSEVLGARGAAGGIPGGRGGGMGPRAAGAEGAEGGWDGARPEGTTLGSDPLDLTIGRGAGGFSAGVASWPLEVTRGGAEGGMGGIPVLAAGGASGDGGGPVGGIPAGGADFFAAGAASGSVVGASGGAAAAVTSGASSASSGFSGAGAVVAASACGASAGAADFLVLLGLDLAALGAALGSSGCWSRTSPSRWALRRRRSAWASTIDDEWLRAPIPSAPQRSRISLLDIPSSRASSYTRMFLATQLPWLQQLLVRPGRTPVGWISVWAGRP